MWRKWIIDTMSVAVVVFMSPLLLICRIYKNPVFTQKCIRIMLRPINMFAGNNILIANRKNLEDNDNYLLVSNHLSGFDLASLGVLCDKPISFIAQKQLESIPLANKWFELYGTIFIDQASSKEGFHALQQAIRILKNGGNVGIFPSGTISYDPIKFQPGAVAIAKRAKVKIIPLTIYNTRKVFEDREDNGVVDTIFDFSKPITYEEYKDMEDEQLTKYIEDIIYDKYREYIKHDKKM